MIDRFRVAAVQLDLSGSASNIFERIKKYMVLAKKNKVDIICFPEDTFYAGPKKNKLLIKKIGEECRKNGLSCVLTGHLREKKHVYNTAIIIDSHGNICGKHKKVRVCDSHNVKAGSDYEIIDTIFCKVGLAICWDISDSYAMNSLAKKGARIVFCPLYWCYDEWSHKKHHKKHEKKLLESLALVRAFENLIYIVFCNAYSKKEKSLVSYSVISGPHMIEKEIFDREGMIIGDIDLNYLDYLRRMYKKDYNTIISKF